MLDPDKAARCIQRAYKAYWLRKTIAGLRSYAPWMFCWSPDPQDHVDFDLIQSHLTDRELQRTLCQIMEFLGCSKTSSLCHSKMILIAHTLVQAPAFILENLEQTTGEVDFKKGRETYAANASSLSTVDSTRSRSSIGRSETLERATTCDTNNSNDICQHTDAADLSLFEQDLVVRAKLLGSNFLLVCLAPEDWTRRLSFAASYSNFCRLFLEWKTKDAKKIIKQSLEKFVLSLNNYRHVKGTPNWYSNDQCCLLAETYKSLCEQHYMTILKLVGSSSKCRQIVHRYLLKLAFLKELRQHFGSTKQLVAVEWAENGDETSTYRLRMAFMSLMVSSRSIRKSPCNLNTFISPRLGTRLDDMDPLSCEKWHGSYFTRYKRVSNIVSMELYNPHKDQALWVPPIAFFILDTFQRIDPEFIRKESQHIDMEFITEQSEMNQFSIKCFLDWTIDIAAKLYHVAYIGEVLGQEKRPANYDYVSALKTAFEKKVYESPRFRDGVLFTLRLVEFIRIQHNEQQMISTLNSIMTNNRCHCGSNASRLKSGSEIGLDSRTTSPSASPGPNSSSGDTGMKCVCHTGGILFDIQNIKYDDLRDKDRQKLLSIMNDSTRQLVSNELVLFVRDLQSSDRHNVAKLCQWVKKTTTTTTTTSNSSAGSPTISTSSSPNEHESAFLANDAYHPIFEHFADFMMTLDMTKLPETFEVLRVSVSRAKLLIQDTVKLYVITRFIILLSCRCGYIDRLTKRLYDILTSELCDAFQQREIMALIDQERPDIAGKDKELVKGVIKRLIMDNEYDEVAKLALARIRQGLSRKYEEIARSRSESSSDYEDRNDASNNNDDADVGRNKGETTDWFVDAVGLTFKDHLQSIEDLVLNIWEVSVVTYGPIYDSMISLADKKLPVAPISSNNVAGEAPLMETLSAESQA